MNYVERHFGDWARDTAHLSMLEDGAYNRLCDLYYVREQPLPADVQACCRLVRATTAAERAAVRQVLQEFFQLTDEGWRQKRCDEEIARFATRSGKAREAAAASVAARRERALSAGSANAERTLNERRPNVEPRARGTNHQPPSTTSQAPPMQAELAGVGGPAPDGTGAPPAPQAVAFDGENGEALNGKAVVPLARSFGIPAQWGIDAEALGFKVDEVMRESEKFRQYFVDGGGAGTRRSVKGWRQSWSNWLERAARSKR